MKNLPPIFFIFFFWRNLVSKSLTSSFSKFLIFFKMCFVSSFFPTLIQILVEFIGKEKGRRGSVASLYLYCMYGYTVTVYYTCTVDSRTDPKSGTVFFSFRFHASTHHCRYYCLFLAVNYKNTLPPSPSSSFSPPSSSIVLVQRPQVTSDHNIDIWFYDQNSVLLFLHLFSRNFSEHGYSPYPCQSLG